MFGALRRDDSLKSTSSSTPSTPPVALVVPMMATPAPTAIAKIKPTQRKRKNGVATNNALKHITAVPAKRKRKIDQSTGDDVKMATKKRKIAESSRVSTSLL